MALFGITLSDIAPDDVAHVVQVSLTPAFLLTALATFVNVFSTRLARIADRVNTATKEMQTAGAADAQRLSAHLAYLRRRSFLLDLAVVLACLGAGLTLASILTLFVGALRDATTATVLFACFGSALLLTMSAIGAFLAEILLAGRGVRIEVDRQQDGH